MSGGNVVEGTLNLLIMADIDQAMDFLEIGLGQISKNDVKLDTLDVLEAKLSDFCEASQKLLSSGEKLNGYLYLAISARAKIAMKLYSWCRDKRVEYSVK